MTLRQAYFPLGRRRSFRAPCRKWHLCIQYTCTRKMRGTTSFTEIVKSQGKVPSSQLISYRKTIPNEQEVAKLGISPTENIIRMERVRYADQVPLVYEVASIPEKFIKDFKKEEITSHFFQTLQNTATVLVNHSRLFMLVLLRKKLPTIWKLKKDMLF